LLSATTGTDGLRPVRGDPADPPGTGATRTGPTPAVYASGPESPDPPGPIRPAGPDGGLTVTWAPGCEWIVGAAFRRARSAHVVCGGLLLAWHMGWHLTPPKVGGSTAALPPSFNQIQAALPSSRSRGPASCGSCSQGKSCPCLVTTDSASSDCHSQRRLPSSVGVRQGRDSDTCCCKSITGASRACSAGQTACFRRTLSEQGRAK
jgi:hypothetical protein